MTPFQNPSQSVWSTFQNPSQSVWSAFAILVPFRVSSWCQPWIAALWLAVSIGLGAPDAGRAIDEIAWAEDSDAVVVRYQVSTLPGPEGVASVTIFGDRTVRVVRPAFWVGGGRSEWRLSRSEMRDLVELLAGSGLADADAGALRSRIAEAGRGRLANGDTVRHRAGAARRTLELYLSAFRAGATAETRAVAQRFAWRDLAGDAADFPQIGVLSGLAAAEQRLRAFLSDPRARTTEVSP